MRYTGCMPKSRTRKPKSAARPSPSPRPSTSWEDVPLIDQPPAAPVDRSAAPEPAPEPAALDVLRDLERATRDLDRLAMQRALALQRRANLVAAAREGGCSWATLSRVTGLTRQALLKSPTGPTAAPGASGGPRV